MRIAILAPIAWRTPPQHYGGWELVTSTLAEGLVQQGHQVTLFATADSQTSAQLVAICPVPLATAGHLDARVYESLHIAQAYELARRQYFDIIHNNAGCFPLTYSKLVATPTLTTLHGSAAETGSRLIYEHYKEQPYVSISQAERELAPELNYVETIYNGIAVDRFRFQPNPGEYLVVIGRMSPDKGIHLAIEVAARAGRRLILAGIVPPENRDYFEQKIKPCLKPGQLEFVGPADHALKTELLGGALASLHLVSYREAFGLTIVESMACGTPVIGVSRGSLAELIKPGLSGALVPVFPTEEQIIEAAVKLVGQIGGLERKQIRDYVAASFSVERMVASYLLVYQAVKDNSYHHLRRKRS